MTTYQVEIRYAGEIIATGDDAEPLEAAHKAWKEAREWFQAGPLLRPYASIVDVSFAAGKSLADGEEHAVLGGFTVRVQLPPVIEMTPAGWAYIEGGAAATWGE